MTPKPSAPLVLALALLVARGAFGATPSVPTLDPERLHAGQKAVVRTVFSGETIESFDAEILGVLKGGRSEGDVILARATSERVIRTGVAAGMSGSPVYVEGKLIGALSTGWAFSREPIFGITPIREMLAVLDHPTAGSAGISAGPTGTEALERSADSRFGEFHWDDTDPEGGAHPPGDPHAETGKVASGVAGIAPLQLPLAASGVHSSALDPLRSMFAPYHFAVVPGGQAEGGGPGPDALVPGAAVAVDLLRGDMQLSAIGTVTYRDGDRILIFGHPFFQAGDVRLPLATAVITTIVPNEQNSFKLGVRGREAGVVTQDRRAGVAGRIGGAPHLLPFAFEILASGFAPQRFHFESIEDRALAPLLLGAAATNCVLESGGVGANQTLRWTMTLKRSGAPPLVLSDVIAGNSPVSELSAAIGAPLRFLFNNPFERLALDSIRVTLEIAPGRAEWTLRSARVMDNAVRPGGRVRVRCEIERWRGAREIRDLSLAVPDDVPDGRYLLWVGGGPELARFEAGRLPARYRPISLDDAWRRLASIRSSEALYGAIFARAPEITSNGTDYPELPVSALALLSSGLSAGDRARRGDVALLDEARVAPGGVVSGELVLQINVDSTAP